MTRAAPSSPGFARVLLAAALIFTVLVSGSESGGLVTPVRALGAALGAFLIAVYLRDAPRRHDRADQLVLMAYMLFLAACLFSSIPRLSFDSATTGLAYVAAFYSARRAIAAPGGREFAITVLGMLGTAVALIHLLTWGVVWSQWLSLPDAGPPPFNLNLPTAQFHPVRASLLVALLLPATILLARRRVIWPLGVIGTAASAAVIVMGGSRTTWLALGAGLLVLIILRASSYRRAPKLILFGAPLVLAAGVVVALPQLLARLGTSSTVELRFAMWSDALRAWLESPLTGSGPGTFASAFALTGHYNRYEQYVPHAHNVPVQMLLETGVVGLVAGAVLLLAVAVGVRQGGRRDIAAVIALTIFAVASATETPTHGTFLVLPLLVWAAILAPPTAQPQPNSVEKRSTWFILAPLAAVVALAVGATLAAAAAHDRAAAAAETGRSEDVVRELRAATMLDPSFPLYHRELGAWLMSADAEAAIGELEHALNLNRTDQATIRSLAVARAEVGDSAGSLGAARMAVDRADLDPENALVLAYVARLAGDDDAAWHGMVRAARRVPWILAAPEWDAVFSAEPKAEILREAHDSWVGSQASSYRNARARAWLAGMTGGSTPQDVARSHRAEAAVLGCQPDLAADVLSELGTVERTTGDSLQARLIFARAFGAEADVATERMIRLRNQSLAQQAFGGVVGDSPLSDYTADVNVYRRIPIAPPGLVFPTGASGLSVWLQDPIAAADIGAPGSPLAECR